MKPTDIKIGDVIEGVVFYNLTVLGIGKLLFLGGYTLDDGTYFEKSFPYRDYYQWKIKEGGN
jgi:hypothetical protein